MEDPKAGNAAHAESIAGIAIQVALHDWQWQAFGFRRRPRRGSLWSRFVPAERLAQERFLLREFLITAVSAGVDTVEEVLREGAPSGLRDSVALVLARGDGVARVSGFTTVSECETYFLSGVRAYAAGEDPAMLFMQRAQEAEGNPFRPAWLVSIARVFNEPGTPLEGLRVILRRELLEGSGGVS